MGHRMVLGYGDGLTILLWTMSNDRQVENLSYDVATNFQFVASATRGELRGVWSQSCEVLRVVMSP